MKTLGISIDVHVSTEIEPDLLVNLKSAGKEG